MSRLVIALGGNALEDPNDASFAKQQVIIQQSVKYLVDLTEKEHQIVITHGNGPQVGRIVLQNEYSCSITPSMPFDVCGAMSQGSIGYSIQQNIKNELTKRGLKIEVASLLTQVLVDINDERFNNPTKPIGPFYSAAQAEELRKKKNYNLKEDSKRGFRRVIASPLPISIVELPTIKQLLAGGTLVIAVGGGGIPVVSDKGILRGVDAVIDKDFASARLAQDIDANYLIMLTAVDNVYLNFGQNKQISLHQADVNTMKQYIKEDHFASGSMLPKVEAAIQFCQSKKGRKTIITSLDKVSSALSGGVGTLIS